MALGLGLAVVFWIFAPLSSMFSLLPGAPRGADFAQHVLGQRYFIADRWRWPLLIAANLDVPFGANIGLTDSIPLLALVLKLLRSVLPENFQAITMWVAFAWMCQPAAAVFALRGTGERRLAPALAAAICASATPTLLMRANHAALSAHFTILLALGLTLRIVRPENNNRLYLALGCLLVVALLLVHPYLMVMAAALLVAAPLTLAFRRDPRWAISAASIAGTLVFVGLLSKVLGYVKGSEAPGFGIYSMNLLSPVWPQTSRILPHVPALDTTGGQYEGFQYLGAGVLFAGVVVIATRWRGLLQGLRAHAGLVCVCVGLTALALSNRVYVGHSLIVHWPAPKIAGVFRVSGRFFWPVAYVIEIGSIALLATFRSRVSMPLLAIVATVQFYDAIDLFDNIRFVLHTTRPFAFDDKRLQQMMKASQVVAIYPAFPCEATIPGVMHLTDVMWVAGRDVVPLTTAYTARPSHPPQCDTLSRLHQPIAAGELRVILQGHPDFAAATPNAAAACSKLGVLTVCSLNPSVLRILRTGAIRP